jgi:hypothetical protein
MIKRTQVHFGAVSLVAFTGFINIVMIVVFLPAVAELTAMHVGTSPFGVAFDGLVFQPVGAVSLLVL